MRRGLLLTSLLAIVACASPGGTPSASTDPLASLLAGRPSAVECDPRNYTLFHQSPGLETVLPASIAGRPLSRWSLSGRCWVEVLTGKSASEIDEFLASLEATNDPRRIDPANLRVAVAGRTDTTSDPPFFVFAASRSEDPDEVGAALLLLFAGASSNDLAHVADESRYQMQTVGGKEVAVGTLESLRQDEHQRGRPFLYQTETYMFLVITDDDAWAADALRQLP